MYDRKQAEILLKGLAAGDRNGGPIRLALLLFDEVRQFGFSQSAVFDAYFDWVTTEGFDMGPTLWSVCRYVQQGFSRANAVLKTHHDFAEKTAGIAPAHRAAPLALFYRGSTLDKVVKEEAALSHHSDVAAQSSVATARLCAALLDGESLEESCTQATLGLSEIELAHLREQDRYVGGFAPKVLQTAVSFLRESTDLSTALLASLDFAGPNNYCPVLVGSIGACLYKEVPNKLFEHPLCPKDIQAFFD